MTTMLASNRWTSGRQRGAQADEGVVQDRSRVVVALPGPCGDGVHVGSWLAGRPGRPRRRRLRIARRDTVSSNGRPAWTTRWMLPSGGTVGPALPVVPVQEGRADPGAQGDADRPVVPRAAPTAYSPTPNASASFRNRTRCGRGVRRVSRPRRTSTPYRLVELAHVA